MYGVGIYNIILLECCASVVVQRDDGCGAINDIITQVKMGIPIIVLYIVGSSNTKHYFSYFFFFVKSGENE